LPRQERKRNLLVGVEIDAASSSANFSDLAAAAPGLGALLAQIDIKRR
jgi:hypothetical protein